MAATNLDLQRAQHALARVKEIKALQDSNTPEEQKQGKHYGSYAKALPASILQVGLGQAMALLLAKARGKRTASLLLYQHLQSWLCATEGEHRPYPDAPSLLEAIMDGTEEDYLRAQGEAMAYLTWLKKFATARLDDDRARSEPVDATDQGPGAA